MADASGPATPMSAPAVPLRRKMITGGCALLLLPVVPRLARAATILAVRTWPADEYTRVTLEMDTELKAEHFTLDHPHRLVVDIEGLRLSPAINDLVSKIRPNDPYISTVRAGQNRPDVVRLVFDLKQDVAPQVFTLKPIGEYKYRLVLDLYPKVAQDPLMALLKDVGQGGNGSHHENDYSERPSGVASRRRFPPCPGGIFRIASVPVLRGLAAKWLNYSNSSCTSTSTWGSGWRNTAPGST